MRAWPSMILCIPANHLTRVSLMFGHGYEMETMFTVYLRLALSPFPFSSPTGIMGAVLLHRSARPTAIPSPRAAHSTYQFVS